MEGKTDMKRLLNIALDNAVALGVVVIVLFLIIPLPTFLLDFLLIVNIGLAIICLLYTSPSPRDRG